MQVVTCGWRLAITSPRMVLTWPQQEELWQLIAAGCCLTSALERARQLLRGLREQRPDNLHPIIAWVVELTGGFAPIALGETSDVWEIEPEVPDAEYDAGTLAEIEAQVEEKRQASAATMGRVRRGASGFLGVHLHAKTGRWRARIRVGGKRLHLGYFDTAELAATAYDQAALSAFGALAIVNCPARKVAWLESEQKGETG